MESGKEWKSGGHDISCPCEKPSLGKWPFA